MNALKKKKYRILSVITKLGITLMIVFYASMAFTVVNACDPKTDPNCKPDGTGINTTAPDSAGINSIKINSKIENPLGDSISDIPTFIEAILRFILLLGVPIVALAIIYTGFLFVTALGNSEKLKKAKSALMYTLIGAALLLGAFVIAEAIQGTVVDISSTT